MKYLENRASCLTEVTEYDNIGFDCNVVEHGNGKKNGKKVVTNSKEEASKKRAQRKAKKDTAWALLLIAMPELSAPTSASVFISGSSATILGSFATMPGWSIAVPGWSATVPELSVAVPGLFVVVPGLSAAVPELSAVMPKLSTLVPASVLVPRSSAPVLLSASAPVLPGLSPLLFPALSLPKTSMLNLAVGRRKLDNTISGWSRISKNASSEELWSGKIKKAAMEEAFLSRRTLFLLFFPSSGIGKRKFDNTFINS